MEEGHFYLTPQALQLDSFRLGMKVVKSGFKPDLMIALWRGGAPIGMHVHEVLKYHKIETDHVAIRTSRYVAPGQATSSIVVHNLTYVKERILSASPERIYNILIVDDVWESGGSICALLKRLREEMEDQACTTRLEIRFATLFFKPECNKTLLLPDFWITKMPANVWIVFPHELDKLEVMDPEVARILGGQSMVDESLAKAPEGPYREKFVIAKRLDDRLDDIIPKFLKIMPTFDRTWWIGVESETDQAVIGPSREDVFAKLDRQSPGAQKMAKRLN